MLDFFMKHANKMIDDALEEKKNNPFQAELDKKNMINKYSANASLPQIQNSADLMARTNNMAGVDNVAAANLTSTMPSLQLGGALSTPPVPRMGGALTDPNQKTEEEQKIADSYANAPAQPSPNDFSGQSFNSAFGAASNSGLDTFKWNGGLYNTQTK